MKLWIARDICNISLKLFFEKPVEQEGNWVVKHIDKFNRMYYGNSISIDNSLFPEVTFENSPQLVEIKLVKERCIRSLNALETCIDLRSRNCQTIGFCIGIAMTIILL